MLQSRFNETLPLELWNDVTAVAAVSGGADSILMAELLFRQKQESAEKGRGRLIIAHANHNLRNEESDGDERFVREWVKRHQSAVAWLDGAFASLNIQSDSNGLENACRRARYDWLLNLCRESGARYLFTAHNADDQVETVLYRILRGTGVEGLAGIEPVRTLTDGISLVRPILDFTRKEILLQLQFWGQPFRTDSSNLSNDFARNKIRNQLLPLLERDYNPNARNSIKKLSALAALTMEEIRQSAEKILNSAIIKETAQEIILDKRVFQSSSLYLICECFRTLWAKRNWSEQAMGLSQWQALADMASNAQPPAPRVFPGSIRVGVSEDTITFTASAE